MRECTETAGGIKIENFWPILAPTELNQLVQFRLSYDICFYFDLKLPPKGLSLKGYGFGVFSFFLAAPAKI